MGFALSRTIVYWGFDCAEDSIPFTHATFKTFYIGPILILLGVLKVSQKFFLALKVR